MQRGPDLCSWVLFNHFSASESGNAVDDFPLERSQPPEQQSRATGEGARGALRKSKPECEHHNFRDNVNLQKLVSPSFFGDDLNRLRKYLNALEEDFTDDAGKCAAGDCENPECGRFVAECKCCKKRILLDQVPRCGHVAGSQHKHRVVTVIEGHVASQGHLKRKAAQESHQRKKRKAPEPDVPTSLLAPTTSNLSGKIFPAFHDSDHLFNEVKFAVRFPAGAQTVVSRRIAECLTRIGQMLELLRSQVVADKGIGEATLVTAFHVNPACLSAEVVWEIKQCVMTIVRKEKATPLTPDQIAVTTQCGEALQDAPVQFRISCRPSEGSGLCCVSKGPWKIVADKLPEKWTETELELARGAIGDEILFIPQSGPTFHEKCSNNSLAWSLRLAPPQAGGTSPPRGWESTISSALRIASPQQVGQCSGAMLEKLHRGIRSFRVEAATVRPCSHPGIAYVPLPPSAAAVPRGEGDSESEDARKTEPDAEDVVHLVFDQPLPHWLKQFVLGRLEASLSGFTVSDVSIRDGFCSRDASDAKPTKSSWMPSELLHREMFVRRLYAWLPERSIHCLHLVSRAFRKALRQGGSCVDIPVALRSCACALRKQPYFDDLTRFRGVVGVRCTVDESVEVQALSRIAHLVSLDLSHSVLENRQLEHLRLPALTRLVLLGAQLDVARLASVVLPHCSGMADLNLRNVGLAAKQASFAELSSRLSALSALTSLDLSDNALATDGVSSVLRGCSGGKLRVLSLSNVELEKFPARQLLPQNLEHVDFSSNELDYEQVESLFGALSPCKMLSSIDLSGNSLKGEAEDLWGLAMGISTLTSLNRVPLSRDARSLRVQNIRLDDDQVQTLGYTLDQVRQLRQLRLINTFLNGQMAKQVANFLVRCRHLAVLDLTLNQIKSKGAEALVSALHGLPLQKLGLASNELTYRGIPAIARMLVQFESLRQLDISDNDLGERAGEDLADGVQQAKALVRLDASGNGIKSTNKLANALATVRRLELINLSRNEIDLPNATRLVAAIVNPHLIVNLLHQKPSFDAEHVWSACFSSADEVDVDVFARQLHRYTAMFTRRVHEQLARELTSLNPDRASSDGPRTVQRSTFLNCCGVRGLVASLRTCTLLSKEEEDNDAGPSPDLTAMEYEPEVGDAIAFEGEGDQGRSEGTTSTEGRRAASEMEVENPAVENPAVESVGPSFPELRLIQGSKPWHKNPQLAKIRIAQARDGLAPASDFEGFSSDGKLATCILDHLKFLGETVSLAEMEQRARRWLNSSMDHPDVAGILQQVQLRNRKKKIKLRVPGDPATAVLQEFNSTSFDQATTSSVYDLILAACAHSFSVQIEVVRPAPATTSRRSHRTAEGDLDGHENRRTWNKQENKPGHQVDEAAEKEEDRVLLVASFLSHRAQKFVRLIRATANAIESSESDVEGDAEQDEGPDVFKEANECESGDDERVQLNGVVRCTRCDTWRYPGCVGRADADVIFPEGREKWECKKNEAATIENDCSDAPIWDLIHRRIGLKGQGKQALYRRKIDNISIDISYLFVVVQCVGGFERLNELRKATMLAIQLGAKAKNASAAHALKKIYTGTFKAIRKDWGGDSLEEVLLSNEKVLKTIDAHRQRVFELLGITEVSPLTSKLPSQNNLPRLFQPRAGEVATAEDVLEALQHLGKVGGVWLKAGSTGEIWFEPLSECVHACQDAMKQNNQRMAIAMFGDTGAGKSRIMDLVLRISECARNEYANGAGSELEAKRMLIDQSAPSYACAMTQDLPERLFTADDDLLSALATETIVEEERMIEEALAKVCEMNTKSASVPKIMKTSFLLPSGRRSGSTTACSIHVRRGQRYQVVAEYMTREELAERWGAFKSLKGKRQSLKRHRAESVLREAMLALNTKNEDEGEAFLLSDEIHWSQTPDVAKVLGHTYAFAGAGRSAVKDRMFVRRLLHFLQGIPDGRSTDAGAHTESDAMLPLHPPFGDDEWKRGLRCVMALKRLVVFVPCTMAPDRGSEWIDMVGSGDGDPFKASVFRRAASNADAVLAVVERSLRTSESSQNALKLTPAVKSLVQSRATESDGDSDYTGRVSVIVNHEKVHFFDTQAPMLLSDLDSGSVSRDSQESVQESRTALRQVLIAVMEMASNDEEPRCSEHARKEAATKIAQSEQVPIIVPCPQLFASLVLNTNNSAMTLDVRKAGLEKTKGFELLGVIENFLRMGSKRTVEKVLFDLRPQVAELEKQLESGEEAKSAYPHEYRPLQYKAALSKKWSQEAQKTLVPGLRHLLANLAECLNEDSVSLEDLANEIWTEAGTELERFLEVASEIIEEPNEGESESDEIEFDPFDKRGSVAPPGSDAEVTFLDVMRTFASKFVIKRATSIALPRSFSDKVTDLFQTFVLDQTKTFVSSLGVPWTPQLEETLDQSGPISSLVRKRLLPFATQVPKVLQDTALADLRERAETDSESMVSKALDPLILQLQQHPDFGQRKKQLLSSDRRLFIGFYSSLNKTLKSMLLSVVSEGHDVKELLDCFGIGQRKANVMRTIIDNLLRKFDPGRHFSRTAQETKRSRDILDDLKSMQSCLEQVLTRWKADATDVAAVGEVLASELMVVRQVEHLANTGQRFRMETFTGCIDDCPPAHITLGVGFLRFQDALYERVYDDTWQYPHKDMDEYVGRLEKTYKLSTPGLVGMSFRADHVLSIYAKSLGLTDGSQGKLKSAIVEQALRTAKGPHSERLANLQARYRDVHQFCNLIMGEDTFPDLLALSFLVDHFQRPLNLYVPWLEQPLRLSPTRRDQVRSTASSTEELEAEAGLADAILFLGWQLHGEARVLLFGRLTRKQQRRRHAASEADDKVDTALAERKKAGDLELFEAVDSSTLCPPLVFRDVQDIGPNEEASALAVKDLYPWVTFQVSDWTVDPVRSLYASTTAGKRVVLNQPTFKYLRGLFAQFSERWTWLGGKEGFSGAGSGDNVISLFDISKHSASGSSRYAEEMAAAVKQIGAIPVEHQQMHASEYNRSLNIVRSAHEEVERAFRASSEDDASQPAVMGVVLSLVTKKTGTTVVENELHGVAIGEVQWLLCRKPDPERRNGAKGWSVVFRSEPNYVSRRQKPVRKHAPSPSSSVQRGFPTTLARGKNAVHEVGNLAGTEKYVADGDIVIVGSHACMSRYFPERRDGQLLKILKNWKNDQGHGIDQLGETITQEFCAEGKDAPAGFERFELAIARVSCDFVPAVKACSKCTDLPSQQGQQNRRWYDISAVLQRSQRFKDYVDLPNGSIAVVHRETEGSPLPRGAAVMPVFPAGDGETSVLDHFPGALAQVGACEFAAACGRVAVAKLAGDPGLVLVAVPKGGSVRSIGLAVARGLSVVRTEGWANVSLLLKGPASIFPAERSNSTCGKLLVSDALCGADWPENMIPAVVRGAYDAMQNDPKSSAVLQPCRGDGKRGRRKTVGQERERTTEEGEGCTVKLELVDSDQRKLQRARQLLGELSL